MNDKLKEAQIKAMADELYRTMDDRPRLFPRQWALDQAERMYGAAIKVLDPRNDEPVSLSALRAEKTGLAKDWTTHDVIRQARDIADEWPLCVVLFGRIHENGETDTKALVATPNRFVTQGIISEAWGALDG